MTDEEKEAIKSCNLLLNGDITLHILDDDGGTAYAGAVNKLYNEDLETVLNLIKTQQEEIEKKDKIIDEMAEQIYDEWYIPNIKTVDDVKEYFINKVEEEN